MHGIVHMLTGRFESVIKSRTPTELRGEIIHFAGELGFQTVSATAVIDHVLGRSEFVSVDNTPSGYAEIFHDPAAMRRDPVSQHCKRNSVPIIWDQATYTSQGLGDLWEEQARFGYRTGICMALHLPEGRHFMLGVDRDRELPTDPAELTRMVADLQLFAMYALDAAMRVLVPPPPSSELPQLTARELEALRWTMEGKTAWEVGTLLGITERTAVYHLNNATNKLGCVNKHQAVLKALRLGLIH